MDAPQDPELVGEFLHCRRILQYDPLYDPSALTALMRLGMDFLVRTERRLGGKGIWLPPTRDFYSRYHAVYCAVVGLSDCRFSYTQVIPSMLYHETADR